MDLQAITRGAGNQDGGGLLDGSDCGLGGRPKMRPDEDPHGPLGGGDAPFAGFHGGFQGLPVFGAGYGAGGGGAQGFKPPPIKVRALVFFSFPPPPLTARFLLLTTPASLPCRVPTRGRMLQLVYLTARGWVGRTLV